VVPHEPAPITATLIVDPLMSVPRLFCPAACVFGVAAQGRRTSLYCGVAARAVALLQWRSVRLAVLVPVKRFSAAKGRLTGVLGDTDRARLAEWMASGVLDVVAEIPTFVACDDDAGGSVGRPGWAPR
jgi:hypothetical protein